MESQNLTLAHNGRPNVRLPRVASVTQRAGRLAYDYWVVGAAMLGSFIGMALLAAALLVTDPQALAPAPATNFSAVPAGYTDYQRLSTTQPRLHGSDPK